MAVCECGGRLSFTGAKVPTCSICQKSYSDWRCSWCGEQQPRAIRRGTDRYAEEFGRAFPNVRIVVSNAAHPIFQLPEEHCLVLATNGCEPEGEYSAVVLLDGELLMNRAELRGDESARKHWAAAISMAKFGGEVFLSLPATHPTSKAFESWNNTVLAIAECKERAEAHLPPEYRIAILEGENKEISKISLAIESKGHLIEAMMVPVDSINTRLILRAKVIHSREFSDFLYDLLRYRSLKGSPAIKVRIDPFNI
jgi:primosomal protein N' (replication factor Y)